MAENLPIFETIVNYSRDQVNDRQDQDPETREKGGEEPLGSELGSPHPRRKRKQKESSHDQMETFEPSHKNTRIDHLESF